MIIFKIYLAYVSGEHRLKVVLCAATEPIIPQLSQLTEEELEIDLKIWKELAIEKQVLMRTVTDSLGLNPKVSEEELNQNILKGIARVAEVDTAIAKLESEQKVAMAKLQQNLEEVQVLLGTAEESITALNTEKDSLANTLKANRESSQTEAASLKSQLEQKNKELKKINVALGDSPDNIVAKMKALNKKKRDETDAKQRVEGELKSLKKKNRELQQSLDTEKAKTKQLEKKLEAPGSAGEESEEADSSEENNREKAAA